MANAYKVLKQVTRGQLKMELGTAYHIRVIEKIYQGKELKKGNTGEGGKKMEPPQLVKIVDLDKEVLAGREPKVEEMVVNSVLKSTLEEEYPKDGYVGKCFEITKLPLRKGKNYHDFDVVEIADPTKK